MIVVASMWEFGWNTPIKEADLWYYPMKDFSVDEIAMTPVSGIKSNIKEFPTIEALIEHYNLPVILCDEKGETDLKEFEHPEDALYLFGRTSGSILGQYKDKYPSIRVVTPENKACLWGHQAACIIMYDRAIKSWQ